jgi:hypothetical protein
MKKIDRKDLIAAGERKNLKRSVVASEILHLAERFLVDQCEITEGYKMQSWKNGVLWIHVENPIVAMQIYTAKEDLLGYLRAEIADYVFKDVRTLVSDFNS